MEKTSLHHPHIGAGAVYGYCIDQCIPVKRSRMLIMKYEGFGRPPKPPILRPVGDEARNVVHVVFCENDNKLGRIVFAFPRIDNSSPPAFNDFRPLNKKQPKELFFIDSSTLSPVYSAAVTEKQ
jgi:hypothetical protein